MAIPLLILTFLTIFVSYKLYQRFRFKLPPGPPPRLIVGNLHDIKPVFVQSFTEWAQVYGPIFSVYLGSHLNVVVNSAELAKQVLKDNDQQLAYRNRNRISSRFSKNGMDLISADYGPHYVKVRKLCTLELFSMKRVESLRPVREDEVNFMIESIYKDSIKPENKGKALELRHYLETTAFLHLTRLNFGKRFMDSNGVIDKQGQELRYIMDNGSKLGSKKSFSEFLPWFQFLFKSENAALDEHDAMANNFTIKIMEEHKLALKKSGSTKSHFVDALLTLQKEYELSDDSVIALLWNMIAAGIDTVIITAEWAMAEMVRNPRVQQKIQEELDRVIGRDRTMTESDIPKLPYLQFVVKECLRVHPPTPLLLPHKANSNVKIGGYDIPKGATVNVNLWALARDPEVWKDPLEFRPERFIEEDIDMRGTDYRLLPFGSGRRICPGAQLAINFVTSMLGHMMHHFTWSMPAGMGPEDIDMDEQPGVVVYMKTPLKAVPTSRLSADLCKRVAVGNA